MIRAVRRSIASRRIFASFSRSSAFATLARIRVISETTNSRSSSVRASSSAMPAHAGQLFSTTCLGGGSGVAGGGVFSTGGGA